MRQPMSVGAILDRTFKTYRDKFIEISLFSLLIGGTMALLISIFEPGSAGLGAMISIPSLMESVQGGNLELLDIIQTNTAGGSPIISLLLNIIDGLFVTPFVTGGIIFVILSVFHGHQIEKRSLFSNVQKIYGRLLVTNLALILFFIGLIIVAAILISILMAVVFAVGMATLIIVVPVILFAFLFVATFTMFVFPAVVFEEKRAFRALGRAFQLFRYKIWKSFLLLILVTLMVIVISWIFSLIAAFLPFFISTILVSAVQGIVTPIPIIAFAYLYLDIRMTKEGYDLELRALEAREVQEV